MYGTGCTDKGDAFICPHPIENGRGIKCIIPQRLRNLGTGQICEVTDNTWALKSTLSHMPKYGPRSKYRSVSASHE